MKRRIFLTGMMPTVAGLAGASGAHLTTGAAPAEPWLRDLRGKHRQFFDVNAIKDGAPLTRVGNFFDAYRDAYGLADRDLNALVGIHGDALGLVLSDAAWKRFELGVRYAVTDPESRVAAVRNIYARRAGATSVAGLQAKGARFLACRQTIARLARELAAASRGTEAQLREAIEADLLPGVIAVPAMIIAANRAQEEGISYVFVG